MICTICPHRCDIPEDGTGFCRARTNTGGVISCNNYGQLTALALDPIEKKPLYRFHPRSFILSAGSYGCSLCCPFCQNSDISMADARIPTTFVSPDALVQKALSLKNEGNIGVAFTYNEPLVGYEYVRDTAVLAHENGLKTVLVTNGMICEEPLLALLPLIDAMNIDLKAFTQRFYDRICGDLATVKRAIELSAAHCHVEVTTLIVPGENDSEDEIGALAAFLANIDPALPLHLSRFFPRYRMRDASPTPVSDIQRLCGVARRHLKHVYPGNC